MTVFFCCLEKGDRTQQNFNFKNKGSLFVADSPNCTDFLRVCSTNTHYWNNATWRSSFFIVSGWVVGYANLLLYVSNIVRAGNDQVSDVPARFYLFYTKFFHEFFLIFFIFCSFYTIFNAIERK